MFKLVEREIFPFLWTDHKEWVARLFEPVLTGRLNMAHDPVLIHGDLGSYQILSDRERGRINGVIDFGVAGKVTRLSTLGRSSTSLGSGSLH